MRLLLDTHTFLWWLTENVTLDFQARRAIEQASNSVFVSAASFWEISIKQALGKITLEADLVESLQLNRFQPLAITPIHALAAGSLPLHHKDPFDRMLIAQAREEGLVIITRDPVFKLYEARVMDA